MQEMAFGSGNDALYCILPMFFFFVVTVLRFDVLFRPHSKARHESLAHPSLCNTQTLTDPDGRDWKTPKRT